MPLEEEIEATEKGSPSQQSDTPLLSQTNSPLSNIVPRGNETVNVNSFQSPDMKGTDALPNEAYYPNVNQPINVGNYSGSIIGSNSIYAPAAALAPLGMMDARDAAIHKAALQKQLEEQKFIQNTQYHPTKLDAANPKLLEAHNKYINDNIAKYKSIYGAKNGITALNNSPEFWQGLKGFQNAQLNYDHAVESIAKYDTEKDKPGFVPSKEAEEAKAGILNGVHFSDKDPLHPDTQNLVRHISNLNAANDLDKINNEALDKAVAGTNFIDKNGNSMYISDANGNKTQNPKYDPYDDVGKNTISTQIQQEVYSDKNLHVLAKNIYETYPYLHKTEEQIFNNLRAKKDIKETIHSSNMEKWYKPNENQPFDYSNLTPNTKTFNQTEVQGTDAGGKVIAKTFNVPLFNSYNFSKEDQKTPVTFPVSSEMKSLNINEKGQDPFNTAGGSVNVNSNAFGLIYKNQNTGHVYDEKEVEDMKKNGTLYTTPGINAKPVGLGSVLKTTTDGEQVSTGAEIRIPLELYKDKYPTKGLGNKLQEVEDLAKEETNKMIQAQAGRKHTAAEVKHAEDAVTPVAGEVEMKQKGTGKIGIFKDGKFVRWK